MGPGSLRGISRVSEALFYRKSNDPSGYGSESMTHRCSKAHCFEILNFAMFSRLAGFQRDSLKRKYQHVRQKKKKKNKNNHENQTGATVPAAR